MLSVINHKPTQQRAIMIFILLDEKYFSEQEKHKLIFVLNGSVAESFIVF